MNEEDDAGGDGGEERKNGASDSKRGSADKETESKRGRGFRSKERL